MVEESILLDSQAGGIIRSEEVHDLRVMTRWHCFQGSREAGQEKDRILLANLEIGFYYTNIRFLVDATKINNMLLVH
jgi:hypothetical protein